MTVEVDSVLLVEAAPADRNRNRVLLDCVDDALRNRLGDDRVSRTPLRLARARLDALDRGFVLAFGSALPEECEYASLAASARARDLPFVFWATDDPYELDASEKFAPMADLVFTNDRWSERFYRYHRRSGVAHLPLAASEAFHERQVLDDDREYVYDVFFCGVGYDNRRAVIHGLHPVLSSVNTLVCGSDWIEDAPYVHNRRLDPSELTDAHRHARIVLNLGRNHSLANERFQVTASTPGPRTFEAALAGACQLALTDRPEIADYYAPGREIVLFDDAKDATEAIRRLLAHPEERIAIARAAQERTRHEHLYVHRVDRILEAVRRLDRTSSLAAAAQAL